MQLAEYFETLAEPLFAIVDLALERPLPAIVLAAAAVVAAFLLV